MKSLCARSDGWAQTVNVRQTDRIDPVMKNKIQAWARNIGVNLEPRVLFQGFVEGSQGASFAASGIC